MCSAIYGYISTAWHSTVHLNLVNPAIGIYELSSKDGANPVDLSHL